MWVIDIEGNALEEIVNALILSVDAVDQIFVTTTDDDLCMMTGRLIKLKAEFNPGMQLIKAISTVIGQTCRVTEISCESS